MLLRRIMVSGIGAIVVGAAFVAPAAAAAPAQTGIQSVRSGCADYLAKARKAQDNADAARKRGDNAAAQAWQKQADDYMRLYRSCIG